MTSLRRETILGLTDQSLEELAIPEWGGSVFVRVMSGTERDAFEQAVTDRRALGNFSQNLRAFLVTVAALDEEGRPIFTVADVEALGAKSWVPLDRIVKAFQRLNKLSDAEIDEAIKN